MNKLNSLLCNLAFAIVAVFFLSSSSYSSDFQVAVRSKYKSPDPNMPDSEIIWLFDESDSEVSISRENSSPILKILKSGDGTGIDVKFLNNELKKGKAIGYDSKGRSKPEQFLLSDGHPAPFDWINPQSIENKNIIFTKTASGMSFKSSMIKTIIYLTYDEALAKGYINDDNSKFINKTKKLILFRVLKDNTPVLCQLWQEDGDFWLYESTGLRSSHRIK